MMANCWEGKEEKERTMPDATTTITIIPLMHQK